MDASMHSLEEPCSPKSKKTKAKSIAKSNLQPTPTRSRRRYDPQRRLEVAETRRNGACARCREKKVRCSPAQHKSSAGGSPQTPTDTLSNSSSRPQNDDQTCTKDVNKGKEAGENNILGIEGCVQAAREYLKVAQSHVEEFARFVEAWESSQQQRTGNQLPDTDFNVSGADSNTAAGASLQSSKSSPADAENIVDSNSNTCRTEDIHKFLSDFSNNTYIYKDQNLVSSASKKSTNCEETTLVPKDRNRALRPKTDLIEKTTSHSPKRKATSSAKRTWRPSLKGENQPWVVFDPRDTAEMSQQDITSSLPEQLGRTSGRQKSQSEASEQTVPWSTDHSPSTPSKCSSYSGSIIEETFLGSGGTESMNRHFPIEANKFPDHQSQTYDQEQPFEDFEFHAPNESFGVSGNAMGSGFNFGLFFDKEIPEGLDDPFISPLLTSGPPSMEDYLPVAWGDTCAPPQRLSSNENTDISSLNDACFETPSTSLGIPSLESTPWSFMSQGTAPVTPQGTLFTPSRKPSGQCETVMGFFGQGNELNMIGQPDSLEGGGGYCPAGNMPNFEW